MSNARNLANLLGTGTTIATAKIADDAITAAKIATDAVVADGLSSSAISRGDLPADAILQVISTVATGADVKATSGFVDFDQLVASITPISTSSKIFVTATIYASSGSGYRFGFRIVRSGTAFHEPTSAGNRRTTHTAGIGTNTANMDGCFTISLLDSPSSTAQRNYKVQGIAEQSGTIYLNRSALDTDNDTVFRAVSSITAMEVAQ